MIVYILISSVDYEGTYIHGIVDSLEKAEKWTKKMIDKKALDNKYYSIERIIEELPTGYKIGDESYTYEEWAVT